MNKNEILKKYVSSKPRTNAEEINNAIDQLNEHQCSNIISDIERQEKSGGLPLKISYLTIHQEKGTGYTVEFTTGYTFGGVY